MEYLQGQCFVVTGTLAVVQLLWVSVTRVESEVLSPPLSMSELHDGLIICAV
jgi:hypothetical protein